MNDVRTHYLQNAVHYFLFTYTHTNTAMEVLTLWLQGTFKFSCTCMSNVNILQTKKKKKNIMKETEFCGEKKKGDGAACLKKCS